MTDATDRRFRPGHRLRRKVEFDRVFSVRASAADGVLIVYVAQNDLGFSRLGLVVSRRAGNAVRRNRWKRMIREAFRLSRDDLPSSCDLVVLPRAPTPPTFAELQQSLRRLADRAARKERAKRRKVNDVESDA